MKIGCCWQGRLKIHLVMTINSMGFDIIVSDIDASWWASSQPWDALMSGQTWLETDASCNPVSSNQLKSFCGCYVFISSWLSLLQACEWFAGWKIHFHTLHATLTLTSSPHLTIWCAPNREYLPQYFIQHGHRIAACRVRDLVHPGSIEFNLSRSIPVHCWLYNVLCGI